MRKMILRSKDYNQEQQIVDARYPDLFEPISKILDQEEREADDIWACFDEICRSIRKQMKKQTKAIETPKASPSSGRPSKEQSTINDFLRLHTYILVRDFEGLRWWKHIEKAIYRQTPGRRARSENTKKFTDVLHYILTAPQAAPVALPTDALSDIANQLAYAAKHNVPFQFLIGFLMHVGLDKAAANERAGKYEAWCPYSNSSDSVQPKGNRAKGVDQPNSDRDVESPRTKDKKIW